MGKVSEVASINPTRKEEMGNLNNEMIERIDHVYSVSEKTTPSGEEMSNSVAELSQVVENVASVSEEISAAVEKVSASAEELSTQAEQVSALASSLVDISVTLQNMVNRFKLTE